MNRLYDCEIIQRIYEPAVTFQDGELDILKLALIATHRCTLKCKLCAERTPYYKARYHPTIDFLKRELQAYFDLVNYTMKFEISGGEPFVRNDLVELLECLYHFKKQFGRVRIITNGTLPISGELCEWMQQFGKQLDVLIDCYSSKGKLLSLNAQQNADLLQKKGINCYFREQSEQNLHYNGWVDFGSLTHPRSEHEAHENFKCCAIYNKVGGCFRLKNGWITPCAITQQLKDFGILEPMKSEQLNIFDDSMSVQEKKEHLYHMFSLDFLSSCQYCDGMSDQSQRFPPAEQLLSVDECARFNPCK